MSDEQAPQEVAQDQPERARLFLTTGQYVDVAILPVAQGWEMLVANILQNRGFLTPEMWIPERTIKAVVRNPGDDATDASKIGAGNVVQLRPRR